MMKSNTRILLEHHRRQLHASGLTDETIEQAGIYSETRCAAIAQILGHKRYPKKRGPVLVFPFRTPDGEFNGYKRIKPDFPRAQNGKPIKYESPRGQRNRVYIPPGTVEHLTVPETELLITEGEKKALCADQEGFPCLGLIGVFGFCQKESADLPVEFSAVTWKGRQVRIVFDSDIDQNPNVLLAEKRLAAILQQRGAIVRVVRLPSDSDGAKVGLDDFLVAHGRDRALALRQLLDAAEEPEPLQPDEAKRPASQADAMVEARAFLDCHLMHNGQRMLAFYRGEFWLWDSRKWRRLPEADLRAKLVQHLDRRFFALKKSLISNVLDCLQSETLVESHREMPVWLGNASRNGRYIAFDNGLLDLDAVLVGRSNCLQSRSPLWFSQVCLPYGYDPTAKCPKWVKVVEQNLEGDRERIAILQEWFGLCLTLDTSMQKFLLMVGEGGNGKSVTLAALTGCLGGQNVSHVPLEMFGERFQLSRTIGKLANVCPEIGDLDRIAEGNLKAFTSGDRMQFERKHLDPFEAAPTARLVLSTNNLPQFRDGSSGLWRRMLLLPFRVTIPEAERVYGMDKPEWWLDHGELPGILNWSIAGLKRLRERREFTRSEVCEQALKAYRIESNPARTFLLENYRAHPEGQIVTSEVYERYQKWTAENGYRVISTAEFGKEIARAFPRAEKKRLRIGNGRPNGYVGISEGASAED